VKRALGLLLLFCAVAAQAEDPNSAKGFVAGQVYQFGDLSHINLYNGNLNIALPIGPTYPVSSQLSYSFTLAYSGNNWGPAQNLRFECPNGPDTCGEYWRSSYYPSRRFNAGFGWLFSLGGLLPRGDTMDNASDAPAYRSPDAADHPYSRDPNPVSTTGDGSYLRVTPACAGACRAVEFPDGTTRYFKDSDGQLTQIKDRFNNQVNVTYSADSTGAPVWTINDGIRTHTVSFVKLLPGGSLSEGDAASFYVVKQVHVAKFGGGFASYTFHYDTPANPGVDVTRKIARRGPNRDRFIANYLWLPILSSITLPDGTSYALTTSDGDVASQNPPVADTSGVTGHLTGLTLPTGGHYVWEYQLYQFPVVEQPMPTGGILEPPEPFAESLGIKTQTVFDRDNTKVSDMRYVTDLLAGPTVQASKVLRNTIKTMTPDPVNSAAPWITSKRLENFFNVDLTLSGGGFYSMPFTPEAQPDPHGTSDVMNPLVTGGVTRNLSSKTYDGSNNLLAATYVIYDSDTGVENMRVKSQQTVTNPTVSGGYLDSSSVDNSDFDGYGHYRTSTTGGNFPGQNVRTTTTAYNRADSRVTSGTPDPGIFDTGTFGTSNFHVWPTDRPWILNLYSSMSTTEGSATHKTLASFDPNTGALRRTRTLVDDNVAPQTCGEDTSSPRRCEHDLIGVFTTDNTGNLTKEEYFGGDAFNQNKTLPLAGLTPVGRTYVLSHTYMNGALATTSYLDPQCTQNCPSILDTLIRSNDASTGLPAMTTDSAQLTTLYEYDEMARVHKVTPPSSLWPTTYSYDVSPAAAVVTARTEASLNAGGDESLIAQYAYDGLGRVITESALGAGVTRSHVTKYDSSGRKSKVSVVSTSPDAGPFTTFTYDGLDRQVAITEPDNSTTTFDYSEASTTKRTVTIHTPDGDVAATTKEIHDRQNRLVEVIEPTGTPTFYTYDVADHLTSVNMGVQTRSFVYDGRNFLLSETHPEIGQAGGGTTTYFDYDARGHSHRKRTGVAGGIYDLTFTYDPAERLRVIAEPNHTLKTFDFGTENGSNPTDYRNGKLLSAVRFNKMPDVAGDVTVTETYNYLDNSGQPSDRYTKIQNGTTVLQSFKQHFGHDHLGATTAPGYPDCVAPVNCSVPSSLPSVVNVYQNGLLKSVPGFATLGYNGNGTLGIVSHQNAVTDTITPDLSGMARPRQIEYAGWTVPTCTGPTTPSITPQNVSLGTNNPGVTLTVSATGCGALTYQWYRGASGDVSTPLATGTSYATGSLQATTSFWVRVTDAGTSAFANSATNVVVVCENARIIDSPHDTTLSSPNSGTTLLVTAVGCGTLTYQWYRGNSGDISSGVLGTGSSYATGSLTVTTNFWVKVTDATTNTFAPSATAVVTVCIPARILDQPHDISLSSPNSGTLLSVSASGCGTLTYQWYRGNSGDTSSGVLGTGSSYATGSLTATTSFWVKVIDSTGPTTPSVTATVTVSSLCTPHITEQPLSQTVNSPADVNLHITVTGCTGRNFEWFRGPVGDQNASVFIGHGTIGNGISTITISGITTVTMWARVSGDNLVTVISDPAIITAIPPTPTGLNARVTILSTAANNQITVTWSPSFAADHYRLQRCASNGCSEFNAASPYADNNLAPNTTYVYRVAAVDSSGAGVSTYSVANLATTLGFSTLQAFSTPILMNHMTELLNGLNAVLAVGHANALTWQAVHDHYVQSHPTEAFPLPAAGVGIYASHIKALRAEMDAALTAVGVPVSAYTNTLTTNVPIRAIDFRELQDRTQ
jgi:YD repeat-containing protein